MLLEYVFNGWPSRKAEVQDLQPYWSFRDEILIIDRITMKGRRIKSICMITKESAETNVHKPNWHRTIKDYWPVSPSTGSTNFV